MILSHATAIIDFLIRKFSTPIHTTKTTMILAAATLIAIILMSGNLWPIVRNLVTWCHEGGHAVMSVFLGGEIRGIRLDHNTSGRTTLAFPPNSTIRLAVTSFSGYPAPSIVALLLAVAVWSGYLYLALGLITLMAIATMVMVRNWWGFFIMFAIIIGGGAAIWYIPAAFIIWPVIILCLILLVGGLRATIEAIQRRMTYQMDSRLLSNDVYGVANRVHIPAFLIEMAWVLIWAVVASVAFILIAHPLT